MSEFDRFERRLGDALRVDADLSVAPFEPASIARAAIAGTGRRAGRIPLASSRPARRFGRGRGITLLAAAALLVVGGALAAGSGVVRLPSIVPPVPAPSLAVVAPASQDATSPSPSVVPARAASWTVTGSMTTVPPEAGQTATLLSDGRVLAVGGESVELYDPRTGTWTVAQSMIIEGREFHTATLLLDGRVLVAGGYSTVADDQRRPIGPELYDPDSGTWTATGSMLQSRYGHTATLLPDGRVLVAGGARFPDETLDSAELFDPANGTWSATGKMATPRRGSAMLLPDGRVLVEGRESIELYDPRSGTWTVQGRGGGATATLLRDGTVLFTGDEGAVLYDPASGTWTATGNTIVAHRSDATATLLPDGRVLVAGGRDTRLEGPGDRRGIALDSAELYDPVTGTWSATVNMTMGRSNHTATVLPDGRVLIAGGVGNLGDALTATELYDPTGAVSSPTTLAPVPTPSPTPTAVPTPVPPEAGPTPPNARPWTVTVVNKSSQPATLFVAEEDARGMGRLVASVTPNVVAPGASVKVTFLLPAKGVSGWWVFVNPGPDTGPLLASTDVPLAGEIRIGADGQPGWLSP